MMTVRMTRRALVRGAGRLSVGAWAAGTNASRMAAAAGHGANAGPDRVLARNGGQPRPDGGAARMIKTGSAVNPGRPTAASQRAFAAGQTAMTMDSTAVLASLLAQSGGRFELGTAYFPKPSGAANGGSIVGGASVWIRNRRPKEERQAAWEFVKFITAPEQQAQWYVGTGYFPVRRDAYRDPAARQTLAKYPQFLTAITQLRSSPINRATQGALLGVFPEARQKSEDAIEATILGRTPAEQSLADSAREVNAAIAAYNRTVGAK